MRIISADELYTAVCSLIVDSSFHLPGHVYDALINMHSTETQPLAKETLSILAENARIASNKHIPLCQDCGSVIIFIEIGNEILIQGNLHTIINSAVADTYTKHFLRPSMVNDPLFDTANTGNNTPAFIHTELVEGAHAAITVYLKGGGSENMSALTMFLPTTPIETIVDYIVQTVSMAGPNPCPPLFLGVGIGGTADVAMLNAKKAVLRTTPHPKNEYHELEQCILERCNQTNIGPLGFGGKNTVATVRIKESPSHIASLPVALNLNCHSLRYRTAVL